MTLWTGTELNQIFHTNLPDYLALTGISIDTRTLQPGDLFVALQGENGDGHAYLAQAVKQGAGAVLVKQHDSSLSLPQIVVADTLEGLRILARAARKRTRARVIAITGSVGKTSTKEVLAQVLSSFGQVSYSPASYNNHWGVPLSLALIQRNADFAILEVGMNHPGEIAPLSRLINPELAIITSIAPAHMGKMGSLQAIAEEKARIFEGLTASGTVIVPHDPLFYPFFKEQAHQAQVKTTLTFGDEPGADCRLVNYHADSRGQGAEVKIEVFKEPYQYHLSLIGIHLANTALIAHAVTHVFNLDQQRVCQSLAQVQPVKGRGQHYHLTIEGKPIHLIDDAYNANLTSMLAGLRVLQTIQPQAKGRRLAVLGEMLELGEFSSEHHQQVGEFLKHYAIDKVFLTGAAPMQECYIALSNGQQGGYTEKAQELIPLVLKALQPHDVVFIKGSKGSRVSIVVDALLAQGQLTSKMVT